MWAKGSLCQNHLEVCANAVGLLGQESQPWRQTRGSCHVEWVQDEGGVETPEIRVGSCGQVGRVAPASSLALPLVPEPGPT